MVWRMEQEKSALDYEREDLFLFFVFLFCPVFGCMTLKIYIYFPKPLCPRGLK